MLKIRDVANNKKTMTSATNHNFAQDSEMNLQTKQLSRINSIRSISLCCFCANTNLRPYMPGGTASIIGLRHRLVDLPLTS